MTVLAIVAMAPDRPGLVRSFGEVVATAGGNIERSRLVTLGDRFVIAALVRPLAGDAASLRERLETALTAAGFATLVEASREPRAEGSAVRARLRASTLDHPGIVARLAGLVERAGGEVVSGETTLVPAPWTGTELFRFEADVVLPDAEAARRLAADLHDLAVREGFDLTFEPATSA